MSEGGRAWASWLPVGVAVVATVLIAVRSVSPPAPPVPAETVTAAPEPLASRSQTRSLPESGKFAGGPAPVSPAHTRGASESPPASANAPTGPVDAAFASAEDLILLGDREGAQAELERALGLLEDANPDDPRIGDTLDRMGALATRFRDLDGALEHYERALSHRERIFGADHPSVADSLEGMAGALLNDSSRREESAELAARALVLREKALGPNHPDLMPSLALVARSKRVAGGGNRMSDVDRAEVEALYRRAIRVGEQAHGEASPELATPMRDLAGFLAAERRWEDATGAATKAVDLLEQEPGRDPAKLGASLSFLGHMKARGGDDAGAEEAYKRAIEVNEKHLGEVAAAGSQLSLAKLYGNNGRREEAQLQYERAIDTMERSYGSEHRSLASPLASLAAIQEGRGDFGGAEASYRRAIEVLDAREGGTAPSYQLRLSLDGLAAILRNTNRPDEAADLEAYSAEILEEQRAGQ